MTAMTRDGREVPKSDLTIVWGGRELVLKAYQGDGETWDAVTETWNAAPMADHMWIHVKFRGPMGYRWEVHAGALWVRDSARGTGESLKAAVAGCRNHLASSLRTSRKQAKVLEDMLRETTDEESQ